MSMAELLY